MNSPDQPPVFHPTINLLSPAGWQDYTLLDTGNGEKLEQYGRVRLIRPEPEAIWSPRAPRAEWEKADARYVPAPEENGGHWVRLKDLPERWQMKYRGLKFWLQTSGSRHLGVFPEQAAQWDWMAERITHANRPIRVLNLFGYTGLASLACAQSGAQVTHVDASRKAITWANENCLLSSLENASIRWIVDDAVKYIQRESRRRSLYDGLILDPPKFGRGPKGEVWEFYKLLPTLLSACRDVLSPNPLFVMLTAYAVKASAITLQNGLAEITSHFKGQVSGGEIGLVEKSARRFLSTAIYACWNADNP